MECEEWRCRGRGFITCASAIKGVESEKEARAMRQARAPASPAEARYGTLSEREGWRGNIITSPPRRLNNPCPLENAKGLL